MKAAAATTEQVGGVRVVLREHLANAEQQDASRVGVVSSNEEGDSIAGLSTGDSCGGTLPLPLVATSGFLFPPQQNWQERVRLQPQQQINLEDQHISRVELEHATVGYLQPPHSGFNINNNHNRVTEQHQDQFGGDGELHRA